MIWGAWQIPLAHPILVTCTFNSIIVTCNINHIESTEHCQEVCMHVDGVRRCCVWIHALYNYNTQQSSKHVHGVSGECDQVQEGSNCHYQLPSLLCSKLAAIRTNEIRMNSHYECRAVYTPTRTPTPTHNLCSHVLYMQTIKYKHSHYNNTHEYTCTLVE